MVQKFLSAISIYRGLPKNIYYLAVARMVLGMGNFIIPFLVLLLTDKLGYSATVAGSLAMGVTGTYLLGSFLGGKLSDILGHKLVMVFGEFIGAVLLIFCGFFSDAPVLVPAFLFGAYLFIGLALPASNALVADLSNANNRDAVMSLSYLAYNFGSALGPIMAGYLFWNYTEWIFFGNGFAALFGVLIVATFIQVQPETESINESELEKPVSGSVWSVLRERPRLLFFTFFCGLLWYSLNQMTMASPLYLSHIFGDAGPIVFGKLMTYACVLVVFITPILMKFTSGKAETISLAYAGFMFGFGYTLVMLFPNIPVHFIAWLFLSAGEVLLLTKEGIYLANNSPSSHRGRIQGVLVTLRSILVMPSFIVIGYFIDNYGYSFTWSSVIAISIVAAIGLYVMTIKNKQGPVVSIEKCT
ncbi:Putative transporter [Moritella viscosa]|uniref:Putative transporter n=1 Tax=Moritella viscosa TaxID=80854 RepID=A0A090IJ78_9GAMM|nr:MFS transporter [Moritella viscosa]CED60234.1 transporter, MFS family [Moritella viscosa]SGZ12654.1 Putative transporter [Moritella viscosa]SHO12960.1 Putative transporter [Moritella viscosa]SHO12961.1 Putative transporter [Moritella viscosa]SHO14243.1 Putative transporter [Moritella viscosa]